MEEIEKRNEAGSETSKEDTKSRREFLKSAAIQGAVAALFGAVTFDSMMARAMERVSEIQKINEVGGKAALKSRSLGLIQPLDYSCKIFSCVGSSPVCNSGFSCDGYNCAGGGETFGCYSSSSTDTFDCDVFTCNIDVLCPKAGYFSCSNRYVC